MLNNLFSSFDEKLYYLYSNFFILIYLIKYMNMNLNYSFMHNMKNNFTFFLNEFIAIMKIFKIFFFLIFLTNLCSLNFFNFSFSSQVSFNTPMILMLWLPLLIMSFLKNNNMFLKNLLPLNTPFMLIPIMIIIELISFFIRPITLLLRLCINMIAGHVLATLISDTMLSIFFYMLFPILFSYMLLKIMVSFIQAYIITTLIQMYKEEIYVN